MIIPLGVDPTFTLGLDLHSGVLTELLNTFTRFIANGSQKVVEAETPVAGALLAFQFLKFAIEVGFTQSAIARHFMTFVFAVLWYQFAINSVAATGAFMSWMGSLGSFLAGGNLGVTDIMSDPSRFSDIGLYSLDALLKKAATFEGISIASILGTFGFFAMGMVINLASLILGIVVVFAVLDAKIEVVVGLAFIPFIILEQTRFLAVNGLSRIVGAGSGLAKIAIVVGISYGFLREVKLPADPGFRDCIEMLTGSVVCATLCFATAWRNGVGGALGALGRIF